MKRILLLVTFLVLMLFLISCSPKEKFTDFPDFTNSCNQNDTLCLTKVAVKTNNVSICKEEKCLAALAIAYKNYSYCDTPVKLIPSYNIENYYYDEQGDFLYVDESEDTDDFFTTEYRDGCYHILFKVKYISGPVFCEKIAKGEGYGKGYFVYTDCYFGDQLDFYSDSLCESFKETPGETELIGLDSGEAYSYICYEEWALKTKDLAVCDKIHSMSLNASFLKEICKSKVFVELGEPNNCKEITLDSSTPELLTSFYTKDECYQEIGIRQKDASICEQSSSDEKVSCLALAKNEPELCEKYPVWKKYCSQNDKIELCEMYPHPDWKEYCANPYQYENEGKWSICDKQYTANWVCINIFKNDTWKCDHLFGYGINDCYLQTALQNANLAACLKINDFLYKTRCINDLAKNTTNLEICDQIDIQINANPDCEGVTLQEFGEGCADSTSYCKAYVFEALAKKNQDMAYCNQIELGVNPYCVYAIEEINAEFCKSLREDYQDVCFLRLTIEESFLKQPTNYCNNIKTETIRQDCEEVYQHNYEEYQNYYWGKSFFKNLMS